MNTVDESQLTLTTADGTELVATLFVNRAKSPLRAALISCGTGFPQRIYARFARSLAQRGIAVMTYDYRGMGASRTAPDKTLKRSKVEYIDWGRQDLEAALVALSERFPTLPLDHIAHSVGGHMIGFARSNRLVARQAFIGVGMGSWWQMAPIFRLPVFFMLWFAGPLSMLMKGYIPKTRWGWTGDPLPPRVFWQWWRWSNQPGYFSKPLAAGKLGPSYFDRATAPIRAFVAQDDEYVTQVTSQLILDEYANADSDVRWYAPKALDQRRIGHGGYFKPGLEQLWSDVAEWLLDG